MLHLSRIRQNKILSEKLDDDEAGEEESWSALRRIFSQKVMLHDIAIQEADYLRLHPDSAYYTVLGQITAFPDYPEYLPTGAIVRKISIMVAAPVTLGGKDPSAGLIFFSPAEVETFYRQTVERIGGMLANRLKTGVFEYI